MADARPAQAVVEQIKTLVYKTKNVRAVVEELRVLSLHPAAAALFDTLLAALRHLKPARGEGEENKAIAAVYHYLSRLIAAGEVEDSGAVAAMHALGRMDCRDTELPPRALAALQLYAELATRFPAADPSAEVGALLGPVLRDCIEAVRDTSSAGEAGGKTRKGHAVALWSAPGAFGVLSALAGTSIAPHDLVHAALRPGLAARDADVPRSSARILRETAARACSTLALADASRYARESAAHVTAQVAAADVKTAPAAAPSSMFARNPFPAAGRAALSGTLPDAEAAVRPPPLPPSISDLRKCAVEVAPAAWSGVQPTAGPGFPTADASACVDFLRACAALSCGGAGAGSSAPAPSPAQTHGAPTGPSFAPNASSSSTRSGRAAPASGAGVASSECMHSDDALAARSAVWDSGWGEVALDPCSASRGFGGLTGGGARLVRGLMSSRTSRRPLESSMDAWGVGRRAGLESAAQGLAEAAMGGTWLEWYVSGTGPPPTSAHPALDRGPWAPALPSVPPLLHTLFATPLAGAARGSPLRSCYGTLVGALRRDARSRIALEAATLLAGGGVPAMLTFASADGVVAEGEGGAEGALKAAQASCSLFTDVCAAITAALNAAIDGGNAPLASAALRAACALGVAFSAWEAHLMRRLRVKWEGAARSGAGGGAGVGGRCAECGALGAGGARYASYRSRVGPPIPGSPGCCGRWVESSAGGLPSSYIGPVPLLRVWGVASNKLVGVADAASRLIAASDSDESGVSKTAPRSRGRGASPFAGHVPILRLATCVLSWCVPALAHAVPPRRVGSDPEAATTLIARLTGLTIATTSPAACDAASVAAGALLPALGCPSGRSSTFASASAASLALLCDSPLRLEAWAVRDVWEAVLERAALYRAASGGVCTVVALVSLLPLAWARHAAGVAACPGAGSTLSLCLGATMPADPAVPASFAGRRAGARASPVDDPPSLPGALGGHRRLHRTVSDGSVGIRRRGQSDVGAPPMPSPKDATPSTPERPTPPALQLAAAPSKPVCVEYVTPRAPSLSALAARLDSSALAPSRLRASALLLAPTSGVHLLHAAWYAQLALALLAEHPSGPPPAGAAPLLLARGAEASRLLGTLRLGETVAALAGRIERLDGRGLRAASTVAGRECALLVSASLTAPAARARIAAAYALLSNTPRAISSKPAKAAIAAAFSCSAGYGSNGYFAAWPVVPAVAPSVAWTASAQPKPSVGVAGAVLPPSPFLAASALGSAALQGGGGGAGYSSAAYGAVQAQQLAPFGLGPGLLVGGTQPAVVSAGSGSGLGTHSLWWYGAVASATAAKTLGLVDSGLPPMCRPRSAFLPLPADVLWSVEVGGFEGEAADFNVMDVHGVEATGAPQQFEKGGAAAAGRRQEVHAQEDKTRRRLRVRKGDGGHPGAAVILAAAC